MQIEIILNGEGRIVSKTELLDLAATGVVGPNTPIIVDGKDMTVGMVYFNTIQQNQLAALVYLLALPPLGSAFGYFLQDRVRDGIYFFLKQLALSFFLGISLGFLIASVGTVEPSPLAVVAIGFTLSLSIWLICIWFKGFFDVLRYDPERLLIEAQNRKRQEEEAERNRMLAIAQEEKKRIFIAKQRQEEEIKRKQEEVRLERRRKEVSQMSMEELERQLKSRVHDQEWKQMLDDEWELRMQEQKVKAQATITFQEALSLFNANKFKEAIGKCNAILKAIPHADTFLLRGMIWEKHGKHQQVVDDCTSAISLNPELQLAYWMRATALKHLIEESTWNRHQRRDDAVADLSKITQDNQLYQQAQSLIREMKQYF